MGSTQDRPEVGLADDRHLTVLATVLPQLGVHAYKSSQKENPLVPVKGPLGSVKCDDAGNDSEADEQHVDEYAGQCEHPQSLQCNLEGLREGADDEHKDTDDGHEYSHGFSDVDLGMGLLLYFNTCKSCAF